MKDCEICGNEIPDAMMTCTFCGGHQASVPTSRARGRIRTVNVKQGIQNVDDGVVRLQCELERARSSGAAVVRIIHGWGSSGKGGRLKEACHAQLRRELRALKILDFIPGEEYGDAHARARELVRQYPDLAKSWRSDSLNYGISLVVL